MRSTEDTRRSLAEIFEIPLEDVKHYVVVADIGGMMMVQFCGMPRNATHMLGSAVAFLAINGEAIEVDKMAAGCTACDWNRS